jgi:hypothetical protein
VPHHRPLSVWYITGSGEGEAYAQSALYIGPILVENWMIGTIPADFCILNQHRAYIGSRIFCRLNRADIMPKSAQYRRLVLGRISVPVLLRHSPDVGFNYRTDVLRLSYTDIRPMSTSIIKPVLRLSYTDIRPMSASIIKPVLRLSYTDIRQMSALIIKPVLRLSYTDIRPMLTSTIKRT